MLFYRVFFSQLHVSETYTQISSPFSLFPLHHHKTFDMFPITFIVFNIQKSETVTLQQYVSCVINIIADERSNQLRVSCSNQLGPMLAMPEPKMHPYRVIKRHGNISKCHGCDAKFDKKETTMILFKKERDWWPDVDKDRCTKQWRTSKRNFYYCVSLSCLMNRRANCKKGKRDNYL